MGSAPVSYKDFGFGASGYMGYSSTQVQFDGVYTKETGIPGLTDDWLETESFSDFENISKQMTVGWGVSILYNPMGYKIAYYGGKYYPYDSNRMLFENDSVRGYFQLQFEIPAIYINRLEASLELGRYSEIKVGATIFSGMNFSQIVKQFVLGAQFRI
jgi:hypothetical protein